jgi:serine/threonine protein kinase
MIKEKTLKAFPVFEYLPKKVLQTLLQYVNEKRVNKTDFIIQSGEPDSNIYFIMSGKVKVVYASKTEHVLEQGDFFGEMAIIDGASQVINAVPVSDAAEVLFFKKQDFRKCIEAHSLLRTALTGMATRRLGGFGLAGKEKTVGSYTILHEIEISDNGVVFLGEHSILKTPVHIRMLPYQFTMDNRYEKRLAGIVKANAHLHHKHIITPIDILKAYGTYFIVRNVTNGISLASILEGQRAVPFRIALEIILQLADGLAFAHKQNIVHRDLRPENIFISETGTVMICDFGITHPDFYNPLFISPEQIKKTNVETLTDIYSFGIICYRLLSGRYPFTGTSAEHLSAHKLKADYKTMADKDSKIPPELAQLVDRTLEPKPEKRLQTLHNIRELLKLWALEREPAGDTKKYQIEELARDEFMLWVQKRFSEKQEQTDKLTKKNEMLYYDFLTIQDAENDYIKYRLVDPHQLIADRPADGVEINFPLEKNKLIAMFQTLEQERQELFLIHGLTRKLLSAGGKYDVMACLKQIIPLTEGEKNYVLLSKKEKKIKQQAERELKGANCRLENGIDQKILETAEKITVPEIIKEKQQYILICPLHTRTKFIGAIALTDKVKSRLETRLGFYTLLAEIMPVAEYKTHY